MSDSDLHKGHRERLKSEIIKSGLENISDIKILEFILFFGIPYKDTNPIAHKLLNRFGSLDCVLKADIHDLMTIKGMTNNACLLLKTYPEMARRFIKEKPVKEQLVTPSFIINTIIPTLSFKDKESLYMFIINEKGYFVRTLKVLDGFFELNTSYNIILKTAVVNNAKGIILAHNHPSTNVKPSETDLQNTNKLGVLLKNMDIQLVDHIVVGDTKGYSMNLHKYFSIDNPPDKNMRYLFDFSK